MQWFLYGKDCQGCTLSTLYLFCESCYNIQFKPYATWRFSWQKIGNGRKLVDCCYIELCLNYDRFLDPTLKCIDKFIWGNKYSICHLHNHSQQKNTKTMCQIYSKVTIKTPESCLVLLLLTLNIFCTLLILSGGNTEIFLGNTSIKCDHDCDQALIKSSWGSV